MRRTQDTAAGSQPEYVDLPLSLFDLEGDIGETTNLAEHHPEIVKNLQTFIEKARKDLGDGLEYPGTDCRPPGFVANNRLLIDHEDPEESRRFLR